MRPATRHGWSTYEPVGAAFTDGLEVLELRGHSDAVIDSVHLVPGKQGNGLKLIGVKLANPTRGGNVQKMPWPPRDRHLTASAVVPAIGTKITPRSHSGANWELLLGIKVTKPGYLVRRAVRVDYHIGSSHYTYVTPAWLSVCTARKYRHDTCPPPPPFRK